MQNYETITVNRTEFSIQRLENLLIKYKPGKYKILWNTSSDTWEMKIRWDGKDWEDLHRHSPNQLYS